MIEIRVQKANFRYDSISGINLTVCYNYLAGGTAEASSKPPPTEDKESQKSKLLANLMGSNTGSNPALANIMSGLSSPNAGGMAGMMGGMQAAA